MPKKTPRLKLTDQIRKAVAECGETQYRICKNTGLVPSTLFRFVSGERGLSMEAIDTLAKYLGLAIVSIHDTANRK